MVFIYTGISGQEKSEMEPYMQSRKKISLSGMKSIKKIIDRNLKEFEEREPKRMKS